MKYILLPALILTGITVFTTGCSNDVLHSHDIYRAEYKYKPLPSDVLPPGPTNPAAGGAATGGDASAVTTTPALPPQ